MPVSLAAVDYIPVALFLVSGLMLMRDLYNKMSKGAFALMSAGVLMVVWAGAYKATWKLFYALGVADLYLMNDQFLPMQAAGFLNLAIGLCGAAFLDQGKGKSYMFIPTTFALLVSTGVSTVPQNRAAVIFIVFMVLGLLGFCGSLSVIAGRMKKPVAVALFAVAFLLLMSMGYLGSREWAEDVYVKMNWIEEGINTVAQLSLISGLSILHKAGLQERKSLK